MREYIPGAPITDEVKKQNQNLPGQGGVFNVVNLHTYHYAGNNPVKYVDPDGRQSNSWIDVKNFYNYTMGSKIASLVANTGIKYSSTNNRAGSAPWGTVYISTNSTSQGGYNPSASSGIPAETGHIGRQAHELWHQVQYKTDPTAFAKLCIEQANYSLNNGYDPYVLGDPANNPSILNTIKSLSDIEPLEGQAQFVGQWNADVFEWMNGGSVDMNRLKKEAWVIINSGINSPAAQDIISLDSDRG
jgi:hypothetical protein